MSESFDYVVVGGGPAGCAVAARLAEARPDLTVALIERGPRKAGAASDIPLGIAVLSTKRNRLNYGYDTAPQPMLGGRRGYQPRGRGLGGSALINAMIYIRGQREDYDELGTRGRRTWLGLERRAALLQGRREQRARC